MDLLKPFKALRLAWMILSKEEPIQTPVAQTPKELVQELYYRYNAGEITYADYFEALEREGLYERLEA